MVSTVKVSFWCLFLENKLDIYGDIDKIYEKMHLK